MTSSPRSLSLDDLPKNYNAADVEAKWRSRWETLGISHWDPTRPRSETFVVDTPPPTASGYLHIGHVFSYTHQDLNVRYRRMRGWNIFYPMGWDDNGLPTERRVQDFFHITCDPTLPYDPNLTLEPAAGKPSGPPRPVSRGNFIEACHQVTREDEKAFKELFQRIGLSVDWDQEYATIDDRSRATAQASFLDLYRRGHIFQTEAPTMWDPEFQTAVAQAEVEDREQDGAFHDIEFAVEGSDQTFTIATTRPELLAACVGVATHPDDERYAHLIGKRAITPLYRVPVPIFASELVDREVGTGILMVCTFGDQTDVLWWRTEGLPLRQVLSRGGTIEPRSYGTPGWESLDADTANRNYQLIVGKSTIQARAAVVEQLRDPGNAANGSGRAPLLAEPRPIRRSVRFYERSKRPLEYVTSRQWYVRLTDKKQALIDKGREINWRPEYMRKRYENWTEGLQWDWLVSRQRFFGIPIPVWYRLDNQGQPDYDNPVLPEAAQLPVDPMAQPAPGYDESQRNQPGGFTADPDVFDTWFTSSLTPQIAARWKLPGDSMDRLFPMDVRPQSHEIIRTWAFYTIAKALLHHETVPWHNVIISGWVLDPDRKKMSKSKGNVVTPIGLLDQYGADAVRYWSASARLGVDTAFDEQELRVGGRLVTKLFNAAKYVLTQPVPPLPDGADFASYITEPLDRAFMAELQTLVDRATASFEEYEFGPALQATESFFWGTFTDNYLELVKGRARGELGEAAQRSAVLTLRLGMNVLLRLFAPILPNVTEEAWSWAFAEETGQPSIHRAPWPSASELPVGAGSDTAGVFGAVCDAVAAVRKAKTVAKIGLGYDLTSATISGSAADLRLLEPVREDLRLASRAATLELRELAERPDSTFLASIAFVPRQAKEPV